VKIPLDQPNGRAQPFQGGVARAKKLSAERRKEIATKASKAAAKVRSAKAKEKRKKGLKKANQQGE